MRAASVRMTFCRYLCMSWHLHVLAPRVHLGGSGPTKTDRWETRATARLSMITARAQRVVRGTFDAQQDFSSHGASSTSAMKRATSRVVRRRQTWPSASQVRPGSAWSGWARCDRQRTMYTRASPAAHPELSRALQSGALPRARVHGSL